MLSRSIQLTKILGLCLALTAPLGCKDKGGEDKPEEVEVLDEAPNGSPVAAEFVEFSGEGEGRGMKVRLYNHGDKTAASYVLLARYYDGDDKPLKVKPGTAFEKDTDFTSLSGGRYKCEPKKNNMLDIDGKIIAVPAEAARAEVLVSKVGAVAADGKTIEDWWAQEGSFNEWPAAAK